METCGFHPQRIALEKCAYCATPICQDCKYIIKGKFYCSSCASKTIAGVTFVPYRNPRLAAFLSLLIPGAGQVYNGQLGDGLKIFLFSWLILPWIYGIYDAHRTARRINAHFIATRPAYKDAIAFNLIVGAVILGLVQNWRRETAKGFLEDLVVRDLLTVSRAAEKYAEDQDRFPTSFSQLYSASPPYLEEILCEVEKYGYKYSCHFSSSGYVFTAIAVENDSARRKSRITVTTGGELSQEE